MNKRSRVGAVEQVKDLVINSACGVYPPRQFPKVGQFTSKERIPGVEEIQAKDLQQFPEWMTVTKTGKVARVPQKRRSQFVKLGKK